MGRVKNKVAVVTGGALGLGASACRLLAKEGAKVAVTDVKHDEAKALVDEIRSHGGTAGYWALNVTNEEEVKAVFEDVKREFGNIDVLVNNAGISGTNALTDEAEESEWDKVMKINVNGVFLCTKHVIPQMREKGGGSIINLSSIAGLVGVGLKAPYHASKGAVRLMTKNDAVCYGKDNIRVNSIHPGVIKTPMVEEMLNSYDDPQAAEEAFATGNLQGHLGEPDDIGYGVLFLASDESKFMTGSELVIDGGHTAK